MSLLSPGQVQNSSVSWQRSQNTAGRLMWHPGSTAATSRRHRTCLGTRSAGSGWTGPQGCRGDRGRRHRGEAVSIRRHACGAGRGLRWAW